MYVSERACKRAVGQLEGGVVIRPEQRGGTTWTT